MYEITGLSKQATPVPCFKHTRIMQRLNDLFRLNYQWGKRRTTRVYFRKVSRILQQHHKHLNGDATGQRRSWERSPGRRTIAEWQNRLVPSGCSFLWMEDDWKDTLWCILSGNIMYWEHQAGALTFTDSSSAPARYCSCRKLLSFRMSATDWR